MSFPLLPLDARFARWRHFFHVFLTSFPVGSRQKLHIFLLGGSRNHFRFRSVLFSSAVLFLFHRSVCFVRHDYEQCESPLQWDNLIEMEENWNDTLTYSHSFNWECNWMQLTVEKRYLAVTLNWRMSRCYPHDFELFFFFAVWISATWWRQATSGNHGNETILKFHGRKKMLFDMIAFDRHLTCVGSDENRHEMWTLLQNMWATFCCICCLIASLLQVVLAMSRSYYHFEIENADTCYYYW